jgi:Tol biopolymer transport system component
MLPNASGLTWIDPGHILFSEIKSGAHMALVTSAESRAGERDVYVPPHARGMVHRSYLSPDGKNVLLAEMDNGGFLPCRLTPFDGSSPGKPVGPSAGRCTSAAWSPDGKWMYLNANTGDGFHIWRQRPDGSQLEQITFGPTEQEGIAIERDGRSLISSVGSTEGSLWIHDAAGERQISGEGSAFAANFSPDGRQLYYLTAAFTRTSAVVREPQRSELWVADLASGKSERVLPGAGVVAYDISIDGKRIVYSSRGADGKRHTWISSLDRRTPPQPVLTEADDQVSFGPGDELIFRSIEGSANYLYRSHLDGSGRRKVISDPVLEIADVSPDGQWAVVWMAVKDREGGEPSEIMAVPTGGGPPIEFCSRCMATWSADGRYLAAHAEGPSPMSSGMTVFLPIPAGKSLPAMPPGGFKSFEMKIPGAKMLPEQYCTPNKDPSTYACLKEAVHRNLFRIPLP